jgi:3-deoxy-D-manno-octulosonate 8-phosphate phosphatase (KDO 8-P phosphatase)
MPEIDPGLLKKAAAIRLLALDVDGVLTDGRLYFDHQGKELKAFNTRDGLGLKALQRYGIDLAIITGRDSRIVNVRASQLGIEHVYTGRNDKLQAFRELLSKTGLDEQSVCYAGDDLIDLPVLQRVGLAVSVPNADPLLPERVDWVTQRCGGEGAVREICDLILRAKGLYDRFLDETLNS